MKAKCSVCGQKDATLVLRQVCHPWAGLEAVYHPKLHEVVLSCDTCKAPVTRLKLDQDPATNPA